MCWCWIQSVAIETYVFRQHNYNLDIYFLKLKSCIKTTCKILERDNKTCAKKRIDEYEPLTI